MKIKTIPRILFIVFYFSFLQYAHTETIHYTDGQDHIAPIVLTEDTFLSIDAGVATQSGQITEDGGSFGITKIGAGTLVMANEDGNNSYSGSTAVEAGSLRMGNDYAVQYTSVAISEGATFDLDGYFTEWNGLSGEGTLHFGENGGFYLYSGGEFSGTLTGQGTLLYNGTENFTLSGNSDFSSGSLSIYSGQVTSAGDSSFAGLSVDGGIFEVAGGTTTLADSIYISSSDLSQLEVTEGGFLKIDGSGYAGLWMGTGTGESGVVEVRDAGSRLQAKEVEVSAEGKGTLTLAGGGQLIVNGEEGIVQLASISSGEGTLNIGAASGETAVAPGVVQANAVDTAEGVGKLVFNHSATDYYFTHNGMEEGTAVLITGNTEVLIEKGVTTLVGRNTYSGGTLVSGGTLIISDVGDGYSVLGSGAVEIGENGILSGSGTILGDTTVFGMVVFGDSAEEMHFDDDLSLSSSSTVEMRLSSLSDFNHMVVDGVLAYEGILSIRFSDGYLPDLHASFGLFDAGSFLSDTQFHSIVFSIAGYEGSFHYETGTLTITAVPEPSISALLAIAFFLGMFLWVRRGCVRKT